MVSRWGGGHSAAPSSAPELSFSTASVASRHRAGTEENFGGVYGTNEGGGTGAGPSQRELAGHRAGKSGDGWGLHQLRLSLLTACVICSCVQHLRASSSPVAWEEQVPSASGAARGIGGPWSLAALVAASRLSEPQFTQVLGGSGPTLLACHLEPG